MGLSQENSADIKVDCGSPSQHVTNEKTQGSQTPISSSSSQKSRSIIDACDQRDIPRLSDLAVSESGFLSDELRSRAC